MYVPGLEQYLTRLWNRWTYRGGRSSAIPWPAGDGWLLCLSRRARLSSWLIFLMFFAGLVGVFALQAGGGGWPQRQFLLLLIGYLCLVVLALYYLFFAHWYCVMLDEDGLKLRRFLVPTRSMRWDEVAEFQYADGDETIKIVSASGRKIAIYASLDGLSALRRCLNRCCLPESGVQRAGLAKSWATVDPLLCQELPGWRCENWVFEHDPFAVLEESKTESNQFEDSRSNAAEAR